MCACRNLGGHVVNVDEKERTRAESELSPSTTTDMVLLVRKARTQSFMGPWIPRDANLPIKRLCGPVSNAPLKSRIIGLRWNENTLMTHTVVDSSDFIKEMLSTKSCYTLSINTTIFDISNWIVMIKFEIGLLLKKFGGGDWKNLKKKYIWQTYMENIHRFF